MTGFNLLSLLTSHVTISYLCIFKRFSFRSPSGDLHSVCPIHRAALLLSYRWTNLCYTNSTVVRTVIELVCTCSILNIALYSLLNIYYLVISENIICWYKLIVIIQLLRSSRTYLNQIM